MDKSELNRTIDHVAGAIGAAHVGNDPFYHLELKDIFPADVYARMLALMPVGITARCQAARKPPAP